MVRKVEPDAARKQVIRQRNVALGLVLAFLAALFFAITVVKMHHVRLPRTTLVPNPTALTAGSAHGH